MASKTIDKNVTPLYNNVPDQRLTQAHQLTIKAWNDIINILKVQANINTELFEKLYRWLIGDFDSTLETNIIMIPEDIEGYPSFSEYIIAKFETIANRAEVKTLLAELKALLQKADEDNLKAAMSKISEVEQSLIAADETNYNFLYGEIQNIIKGVYEVAKASHAVNADNADLAERAALAEQAIYATDAGVANKAIYDSEGHKINEYYGRLEELRNHINEATNKFHEINSTLALLARLEYVNNTFVPYVTYNELHDDFVDHRAETDTYFLGMKAIPKAQQDQKGNIIDEFYVSNALLDSKVGELLVQIGTLKNSVRNIEGILNSDDTSLDTLQELVNALKNNSTSIGDLFTELSKKVSKSDITIDNEEGTSKAVGGIAVGTVLKGKTVKQVLEDMLYPYVPFSISVAGVTPNISMAEKGTNVNVTAVRVTITKGSKNITSLKLYEADKSTLLGSTTNVGTTNSFTISKSINAPVTFYAEAYDGVQTLGDSTTFISFYDPTFYGVLDVGYTLTSDLITSKTSIINSAKLNGLTYTATNQCPFVAYPALYGNLTSIKDANNLECLNDFALTTMNLNVKSGTVAYNVYVLKNPTDILDFKFIFS